MSEETPNRNITRNDEADDIRESADDTVAETRENATAVQETISNGLPTTLLQANNAPNTSTDKSDGSSRRAGWILPLFIANMSLLIIFFMVMIVYGGAVVRTLERRFGLRSAQTGLILSANDVLHVCIVIFIGYFGRKGHKPRIICVTVLFSALAGFMMASPHFFISSTYDTVRSHLVNATSQSIPISETTNGFCLNWNKSGDAISGDQCEQLEQGSSQTTVHPAYYVFLTAQFISGIGGSGLHSLSLAYIDENSPGSKSSLYIGLVGALSGAVGSFLGGLFMSRLKIRPRGAAKYMIFSEIVFTTGLVIVLLLGCPQLHMAGQIDPEEHRFTIITDCNKHCACPTNRKSYAPVCGSDNLTYFSACAAGCRSFVNGTYSECGCIGSGEGVSYGGIVSGGGGLEGGIEEGGWAQPGLCRPLCNLLIPFAVTIFLITFIGSTARVPSTIVNLRVVDDDERAFALSINSFALNLLAFVPGPLLYGSLIDSACILWQTTCKKTGGCLLFNTDRFRYVTYGMALGFEVIDLLLTIVLFLFVRKMVFPTEEVERKVNRLNGDAERQQQSEQAIEMSSA